MQPQTSTPRTDQSLLHTTPLAPGDHIELVGHGLDMLSRRKQTHLTQGEYLWYD